MGLSSSCGETLEYFKDKLLSSARSEPLHHLAVLSLSKKATRPPALPVGVPVTLAHGRL